MPALGFGFASVLAEIGLPRTEVPAALLFFNVGVEVGQLLFVAAVFATSWLIRRLTQRITVPQVVHTYLAATSLLLRVQMDM